MMNIAECGTAWGPLSHADAGHMCERHCRHLAGLLVWKPRPSQAPVCIPTSLCMSRSRAVPSPVCRCH